MSKRTTAIPHVLEPTGRKAFKPADGPLPTATYTLVRDAEVRVEFDLSDMGLWRWDHDEELRKLGWPPPIVIRGRKYRSKEALDAFKKKLIDQAIANRKSAA